MAHLGAILKHPNMFGLRVIATGLYTIGSRLQANIVTSLQVLHALLEFYPNQRVFRILLHNSLSFLLLLEKTILPVLPSPHQARWVWFLSLLLFCYRSSGMDRFCLPADAGESGRVAAAMHPR